MTFQERLRKTEAPCGYEGLRNDFKTQGSGTIPAVVTRRVSFLTDAVSNQML